MTTPQEALAARIRAELRALPMETCAYVHGVLVTRQASKRGYLYAVGSLICNLDQCVWELMRRVQAESDTA